MIRICLFLVGLALVAGCSSTRKVVVNHGYPGATSPPGFEPRAAERAPAETPVRFP